MKCDCLLGECFNKQNTVIGNYLCITEYIYRGGKHNHKHTWMEILNPSTSVKAVMIKLQNLFIALVNMDIFQMTLKLSLLTVDF